jgi:hypothetical protein
MSGILRLVANGAADRHLTSGNLFVPLQFWFNYDTNLSIPVVSLPINFGYNNNEINIDNDIDIDIDIDIYNDILNLTDEIIEINRYESCIISFEEIKNNENIVKCSQCSKIIRFELMQEWFTRMKNCPHCRGTYPTTTFLCGKSFINNNDDNYDNNGEPLTKKRKI